MSKENSLSSRAHIPIHRKIESDLRAMLIEAKLPSHAPFLSEIDLCKRYGVNAATARKAVDRLAEEGLLYKLRRKGTFVAPPARNKLILIVTVNTAKEGYSVVGQLTKLATKFPQLQWQEIGADDLRPLVPDIIHIFPRLSGVLFIRDLPHFLDIVQEVQRKGIPAFFYGSNTHAGHLTHIHSLLYDEAEITRLVLNHLVKRGCKEIGFVGGDEWPAFLARHQHYQNWILQHQVHYSPHNLINLSISALREPKEAFEVIRNQLARKKFSADGVFCVADNIASIFTQAALSLGMKIPSRSRIVGVEDDGVYSEGTFPQITAVRIPLAEDVRASIAAMAGLSRNSEIVRMSSHPQLIHRQSS